MEAITDLAVELRHRDESEGGGSYFYLTWTPPACYEGVDSTEDILFIQVDYKLGDSDKWDSELSEGHMASYPAHDDQGNLANSFVFDPLAEGYGWAVDLSKNVSSLRLRYEWCYTLASEDHMYDYFVHSEFSNIVSLGTDAPEKTYNPENASSWAVDELDKAVTYGFITDKIADNMKGDITREEFAEIVVLLYEKLTGTTVTADANPFTDTTNPEIIKAARLGIVKGVGNNKFAPNSLVTREQIAVMLFRAIKLCAPSVNTDTSGVATFTDEGKISS